LLAKFSKAGKSSIELGRLLKTEKTSKRLLSLNFNTSVLNIIKKSSP